MTDLRPQIAIKLRLAAWRHPIEFPHGGWRQVNEELGALRLFAMRLDPDTCGMGNAMCADYLRQEHGAPAAPRTAPPEALDASTSTPHRQTHKEATQ